jgi:phytoene dehydrogenase-like protein
MTKSVVIIGGGHNGLTAATYLARAGISVTVLERLEVFGGAAISAQAFEGIDARLSRYSYLVSLFPQAVIDELGLKIQLAERRYSSYTPVPSSSAGLLVDNFDPIATEASFAAIGAARDWPTWQRFYGETRELAELLWPTVLEPLMTAEAAKARVEAAGKGELWRKFIGQPVGETIQNEFENDLVRGVVYTDALIGTFADNIDETLAANRCFLYHVIGGGTGDWRVPIGGMGAVTGALERAARQAGVKLVANAEVTAVTPGGSVTYSIDGIQQSISGDLLLVNTARSELAKLLGETMAATLPAEQGAQVKVNLLLSRLPRLKDPSIDPAAAFGGTFHINETWWQLGSAYQAASMGSLPNPMPCEIYCHSLTDPSILSPELQASGAQTLTVFALHAPHALVANLSEAEHDAMRAKLERAVISSLNAVLAEPIEPLLMLDASGRPCIETKTTRDLEQALRLPGGNIFHEPLSWPFADAGTDLDTPAKRWGVATEHERILLCGSAAQRGGAVSGIAGHNAAMAVLEMLQNSER